MRTLSRRSFLGYMAAVGGAALLPRPSMLLAQSQRAASGRNLIVVNLYGGCDGLGAFPYYEGPIANLLQSDLRKTLAPDPGSIIRLLNQTGESNKIGLHPAFKPLTDAAGEHLAIIQGYGIPGDPGRSHDTCQALMSLGATELKPGENVGFLARLMDRQEWESYQYWAFAPENLSDVNTRKKPPLVVGDVDSLRFPRMWWDDQGDVKLAEELSRALLEVQIPRDRLGSVHKAGLQSLSTMLVTVRNDIARQIVGNNQAGDYTKTSLGLSFRDTARIVKAKRSSDSDSARDTLILIGQGGYDTHSGQADPNSDSGGLGGLLDNLSRNLAVLYRDLESMGASNDTVVVVYSEFGRTVRENGARGALTVGTDHGHASNTLALSGAINKKVLGEPPALAELQDEWYDALVPRIDFRDIFSDVLEWMSVDPTSVFDEKSYQRTRLGLFD